jgi:hypothetical protein
MCITSIGSSPVGLFNFSCSFCFALPPSPFTGSFALNQYNTADCSGTGVSQPVNSMCHMDPVPATDDSTDDGAVRTFKIFVLCIFFAVALSLVFFLVFFILRLVGPKFIASCLLVCLLDLYASLCGSPANCVRHAVSHVN